MKNSLRELRRRSNLTQIELAQKSGVPRCRIQLAEAGTVELRPQELQAIKRVVTPELARTAELLAAELISNKESNHQQTDRGTSLINCQPLWWKGPGE